LLSALTSKAADNGILVVNAFTFDEPKTSTAVALLKALKIGPTQKVMLVLSVFDENVVLSFRNLPNMLITTADMLGTYDVLSTKYLLFEQASIQRLQELKRQPLGISRWMAKQAQGGAQ
jgi:large subunit ribosomal protein L4